MKSFLLDMWRYFWGDILVGTFKNWDKHPSELHPSDDPDEDETARWW